MKKLKNTFADSRAPLLLLEFALVAPILIAILIGIMEFGFTMFYDSSLNSGIRTAARQGSAIPYTNISQINTIMNANLGGLYDTSRATLVVQYYNDFNYPLFIAASTAFPSRSDKFFCRGATATITGGNNNIAVYGVKYQWGGLTGIWPFVPQYLYSFSIVKNECFTGC